MSLENDKSFDYGTTFYAFVDTDTAVRSSLLQSFATKMHENGSPFLLCWGTA